MTIERLQGAPTSGPDKRAKEAKRAVWNFRKFGSFGRVDCAVNLWADWCAVLAIHGQFMAFICAPTATDALVARLYLRLCSDFRAMVAPCGVCDMDFVDVHWLTTIKRPDGRTKGVLQWH